MEPYLEELNALEQAGSEERGAVFTRPEVVEFILDLVGYTIDKPLHRLRLLEPSCGDGNFLIIAVERLLEAWLKSGDRSDDPVADLSESLMAVELHKPTKKREVNSIPF
jgi:type I restriction-modification system DNA methylase subunit